MLVFSTPLVGATVAVVNIAVVKITEDVVGITLVVSGAIDVSVSVIINEEEEVEISLVVSGRIVGEMVAVGEMVTSTSVSFVQVHLLKLFCDVSLDKVSSESSVCGKMNF